MSGANALKASTGINSLTPREGEILAKAWACLKTGPPEIDYEKLADECGMRNHRSAANAWSAIKKKMAWSTSAAVGPGRPAARAGAKRKKTADPTDNENSDEGEVKEQPPAKKTKGAGKKATGTSRKKLPTTLAKKSPSVAEESSDTEVYHERSATAAGTKKMKTEASQSGSGAKGEAERPIKNEPEPDVESDGT
ncbi:hypothetical protein M406DRAFT_328065 [Cryphonectria parasitica EP155]|uniref:Uncharacterized protein n=1 Tax=Cryphonectria parasitica (strain ATCC 38755 / EP155) TaxID=660469 RepID=A0A9P4Y5B2_CRYP1|nr:uncharacterized protein M406DRAFT_328065 [Cryphonectria parasitica EP155]KAF3766951.1 hypothetical protein M406DRAFT_328065 [Cryphonectria parasitica EP155]